MTPHHLSTPPAWQTLSAGPQQYSSTVAAITTTIIITPKNPVTQYTTQSNPQFPGMGVTQKQSVQETLDSLTLIQWSTLGPPSPTGGPASAVSLVIGGGGNGVGGLPVVESTAGGVEGGDGGGGGGGEVATAPPPFTASNDVPPTTLNVGGVTVVVGPSSVAIGTVTVNSGTGGSGSGGSGSGGSGSGGSGSGGSGSGGSGSGGSGSGGSSSGGSGSGGSGSGGSGSGGSGSGGSGSGGSGSGGSGSGGSGSGGSGSGDSGSGGSGSGGSGSGGSGGGFNTIVTEGGKTFTVNPSQVVGPNTVISIPAAPTGGVGVIEAATPTVVDGVSVAVGTDFAIVGGSTYAIGAGAPHGTVIVNKENISIGPGGIALADVTITPAPAVSTNVVVFDGDVFSVVGGSVAVFDGTSFTFTGGPPRTTVFNGDTITAGPFGFVDGTSTLGGPSHQSGTQYGLAGGMAISEIGSSIAVIDGTTFTVGPGAPQTTVTVSGATITVGPSGLNIGGSNEGSTTLDYPFNPTTQAITAAGITFSEIGSSLINVGGTTFTIGPGATPTTDVYNGQTISIGPGGVGFATTTIISFTTLTPSPTATKKKNGGAVLRPYFGHVWGACIAFGVGLFF